MSKIPVFYDDRMVADSGGYSPSAAKPKQVVEDWLSESLPVSVIGFDPLAPSALLSAHDCDYVQGILSGRLKNGHGNTCLHVRATFPWTTGSHYAAALSALESGTVACSPTSGFHHAGYDFGGGFCTFNGLMITALNLIGSKKVQRVAIWDLDWHYGNGTADIVKQLGVEDQFLLLDNGYGDDQAFFADMERHMEELNAFDPDIVLYQAGADPFIDDPLGGALSIDQLHERDCLVFDWCRYSGVPVAWNLAGGYTRDESGSIPKVLDIHRNTMLECVRCYAHGSSPVQA